MPQERKRSHSGVALFINLCDTSHVFNLPVVLPKVFHFMAIKSVNSYKFFLVKFDLVLFEILC